MAAVGNIAAGPVGFAAAALPAALPSIVGAAADVAGYFLSNYTIAGRDFDAKAEPLLAAIVGMLTENKTKVIIDGFQALPSTTIISGYDSLLATRWKVTSARLGLEQRELALAAAAVELRKAELAHCQAALTAAEGTDSADAPRRAEAERRVESAQYELHTAEATTADLQRLVEVAKAAEQRVDAFVSSVTTVPATGGLPPLGLAAFREALHEGGSSITHVLHVSVSSSGGETQIRQRRFFAPTLRYVGACTVSVLLAKTDGTVVYAGSQALIGQLTYLIKNGQLGRLKKVELSSDKGGTQQPVR